MANKGSSHMTNSELPFLPPNRICGAMRLSIYHAPARLFKIERTWEEECALRTDTDG
jgi:hypothetical protein